MEAFNQFLDAVNSVIWANWVLYAVLAVGVLFTLFSGFCQYRALVHGTAVVTGRYDNKDDPGAINHFQALSAALSATVGLGNIAGVALAIALGGPGAVFWMWIVGLAGMALKTTSVTLSMIYRNVDDPENPHGGPMWVAEKGLSQWNFHRLGVFVGFIFCLTLLISAITGGNMFQAWNVAEMTQEVVPSIPKLGVGIVLAIVVGLVIIGGIKRIGHVAGFLVPFMCIAYVAAGVLVLAMNISVIPEMISLIFKSAFSPQEAGNAFLGGSAGYAFLWGMKRALFSSEAGQGSSPIAHSAAKTNEPVREALVAGLEPFIDTLVVCTLTALVILCTGAWDRDHESTLLNEPQLMMVELDADAATSTWNVGQKGEFPLSSLKNSEIANPESIEDDSIPPVAWFVALPDKSEEAQSLTGKNWQQEDRAFVVAQTGNKSKDTNSDLVRVGGRVVKKDDGTHAMVFEPNALESNHTEKPTFRSLDVYKEYPGATLTAHAFDRSIPGLGTWLVLVAAWLFAISTMISWSYYGEQGMVYMLGEWSTVPYKVVYCAMIIVATLGFMESDKDLDNLTALGTGVMLWANIPIMLIFGFIAMKTYRSYIDRLRSGEFKSTKHRNKDVNAD